MNFMTMPFASIWKYRHLMLAMVAREIAGKYRGSLLGGAWLILTPISMLAVYGFVFGVVFQARWGQHGSSDMALFAASLYCGLAIFSFMAEIINRAPSLIVDNVNYVKKVIFPLEVLPMAILGSALFHFVLAMMVLLAFLAITGKGFALASLAAPLLILPLTLMLAGISWMLAALGVYFRDLSQVMSPISTALLFLSPALYPIEMVPQPYRDLLALNPLTVPIESMRQAVIYGTLPPIDSFIGHSLISIVFFTAGYALFSRVRKGFADAL